MLDLLQRESKQKIESGVIVENMLDGYYRVNINGSVVTANNQTTKSIPVNTVVSVTTTDWGKFIVSGNVQRAVEIQKIIVRG